MVSFRYANAFCEGRILSKNVLRCLDIKQSGYLAPLIVMLTGIGHAIMISQNILVYCIKSWQYRIIGVNILKYFGI